jgi:RNA polymerase sigma-32 factor
MSNAIPNYRSQDNVPAKERIGPRRGPRARSSEKSDKTEKKASLRLVQSRSVAGASSAAARGAEPRRAVPSDRKDGDPGLTAYLASVRKHRVMSREEEHDIAVRYHETGDARLAQQLVTANLRLVMKLALEYRGMRRQLTDLIQEGNLGLLHAVQKFDPHRGVKLGTYAAWWIRAYMLKYILSNARLVKLGTTQAQRRLFFGLRRTRARLEGKDGVEVGTRQIAASLSVSPREVEEMERRMSSAEASIDGPSRDGDRRAYSECLRSDSLGPDAQSETEELRHILRREVEAFGATLDGRDLVLFKKRILCEDTTTLAKIATKFGVSRERVRQIEGRLKARLRAHLRTVLGDAVPAEGQHQRSATRSPRVDEDDSWN